MGVGTVTSPERCDLSDARRGWTGGRRDRRVRRAAAPNGPALAVPSLPGAYTFILSPVLCGTRTAGTIKVSVQGWGKHLEVPLPTSLLRPGHSS